MKYKQLILRKLSELNNYLNAQQALLSTARSREEVESQIEKIRSKVLEIETLINSEQDQF
jgi:hypothetical protein